jgi:glucokinase
LKSTVAFNSPWLLLLWPHIRCPSTNVYRLPGRVLFNKVYKNDGYESLLEVVKVFLQESKSPLSPSTACFAVAGPVSNNRAVLTNRGWEIDGPKLGAALGLRRIRIVNDFEAVGYGLLSLNEETDCVTLQKAEKSPVGPIACIGPGTGLGECFLAWNGSGYCCYPSEGGHAEFAPRDEVQSATALLSDGYWA